MSALTGAVKFELDNLDSGETHAVWKNDTGRDVIVFDPILVINKGSATASAEVTINVLHDSGETAIAAGVESDSAGTFVAEGAGYVLAGESVAVTNATAQAGLEASVYYRWIYA